MFRALKRAGIEERLFHTGDVVLNYVEGPDTGPPIVFVPGQTMTWEEYALLLPKLAPRFKVYALSVRGHGRSTWTPDEYTFNRIGADLAAFLERVVSQPAIVVGNSSGGVLTAWLAANAPQWVRAIVLEDPPLFRCEWPAIKDTLVFDTFRSLSRMAIAGGGGYPRFFVEAVTRHAEQANDVMPLRMPPKPVLKLLGLWMALHQAISPGTPMDIPFLPTPVRVLLRGISQFDGHFSRAFVQGSMGEGFDHAETLARIEQPVLFLHANWHMVGGRLLGALDDADVARARSLVKGHWTYVRMQCGHAIALEAPDAEASEIIRWVDSQFR